jgi:hypothetical protein
MHNAPSVSFPVGRFAWGYRGLALAILLMALISGAIAWQTSDRLEWVVFIALALIGQLVVLRHQSSQERSGRLSWSQAAGKGSQGLWVWHDAALTHPMRVVELSLIFTLKSHMLVVIRPDHRPARLVWLNRACAPHSWLSMRQAVWASVRVESHPSVMSGQ